MPYVIPAPPYRFGLALLSIVIFLSTSQAAESGREIGKRDLQRHLDAAGVRGCFLLYDAGGNPLVRLNPDRASTRHRPASTFKILNALIALETGVLRDEHEIIPWDGVERWVPAWNKNHDLGSAFAASAVWFYQELARRIGQERMAVWVSRTGYGNGEIGKSVDAFWLEGPLRISPEEQVAFLHRFHDGDLPFSDRSIRIVREIMLAEETESYRVRAKTGWVLEGDGSLGWYVGWVETGEGPRFFTLSIETSDKDYPMFKARRKILRGILSDLGLVLPQPPGGSRL